MKKMVDLLSSKEELEELGIKFSDWWAVMNDMDVLLTGPNTFLITFKNAPCGYLKKIGDITHRYVFNYSLKLSSVIGSTEKDPFLSREFLIEDGYEFNCIVNMMREIHSELIEQQKVAFEAQNQFKKELDKVFKEFSEADIAELRGLAESGENDSLVETFTELTKEKMKDIEKKDMC